MILKELLAEHLAKLGTVCSVSLEKKWKANKLSTSDVSKRHGVKKEENFSKYLTHDPKLHPKWPQ